jgi:hypothetical protein
MAWGLNRLDVSGIAVQPSLAGTADREEERESGNFLVTVN